MSRIYTIQDKVQFISAADTIHDFYSEMKDNKCFKLYIGHMIANGYLEPFGVSIQNDRISFASGIEKKVLRFLNIYDGNNGNDEENGDDNDGNVGRDVVILDFNKFEDEYGEKMRGNNVNKPFCFIVDNFNDETFKLKFAALCSTAYDINTTSLNFMSDTSLIKDNIICTLELKNLETTETKRGKLLISEATKYDNALDNEHRRDCPDAENINQNAYVSRAERNLFGLDSLSVGKNLNNEEVITYSYVYNQQVVNPAIEVTLSKYINNQKPKVSGLENRRRSFFEDIMLKLDKGRNVNKKRGRDDDDVDLTYLLSILYNVYGLDAERFVLNNDDDIIQFMHILFDFKRAGDQLQSKVAMSTNSVFLSNDQLSIAYAQLMGVPCVKTVKYYSPDSPDSKRKLVFYNFNHERILNQLLNKRLYYKGLLHSYSTQVQNVKNAFTEFINQLTQSFAQPLHIIKHELMRKLDIMIYVSSIILLTPYSVDVIRNRQRRRTATAATAATAATNIPEDTNYSDDGSRAYQYKYILQYNIFMCLILKYLLSINLEDEIYQEHHFNNVINIVNLINANDRSALSQEEADLYERLVFAYQNNFTLKFLLFMNLNLSEITQLINVSNAYYYSNSAFYNDVSAVSSRNFSTIFNEYMRMIQGNMYVTNIPIISDYVKLLSSNLWQSAKTYPLKFFSIYIAEVSLPCKFVYFNRATQEWNDAHNSILKNFTEYEYILSKLPTNNLDLSRVSRQIDSQRRGGALPPSRRSKKSPTLSIISQMYKQLSAKHPTFYDLFLHDLKQASEKAANKAAANKAENSFINFNIDNFYGKSDTKTYKHFVKDFYELIAIFIVKHFGIFDEYGNISNKYSSAYDELLVDVSPSTSMKHISYSTSSSARQDNMFSSISKKDKPLTAIKEQSSPSISKKDKPLTAIKEQSSTSISKKDKPLTAMKTKLSTKAISKKESITV
jgi:hypothetical protein